MRELFALELPDAVLGADAPAGRDDAIVHETIDLPRAGEGRLRLDAGRRGDVVVQVAVAEMAEHDELRAGKRVGDRGRRVVDERGNRGDRNRDVVEGKGVDVGG